MFCKKKNIFLLLVFLSLLTHNCNPNNKSKKSKNFNTIHFDVSNWKTEQTIPEKVIKSINFIPLETNEQCLLGNIAKIIPFNNKFYVIDNSFNKKVFVFNKDGRYINGIGRYGRGMGEYIRILDFCIDEKGNRVLVLDSYSRKVLIYSLLNGEFLETIKFDFHASGIAMINDHILSFFSDDTEFGYSIVNLDLHDRSFSKYLKKNGYDDVNILNYVTIYQSANTYYANYFGEIVYRITENHVSPAITFNFGKYKIPETRLIKAWEIDRTQQTGYHNFIKLISQNIWIYNIENIIENDQFLTFRIKIKGEKTLVVHSKKTGNFFYGIGYEGALKPFRFLSSNIANNGSHFLSVVNASNVIKMKKAILKQMNPNVNKKYQKQLQQISYDSNPVIISIEYNNF